MESIAMFDFIASGYIPSIVTSAIAVMLLIGYYIFVIPIMEENKMLKDKINDKDRKLSEITESIKESDTKRIESLDSISDEVTKEVAKIAETMEQIETNITELLDRASVSSEDIKKDSGNILLLLKEHESKLDSIHSVCVAIKDNHMSMMSIFYGLRSSSSTAQGPGVGLSPPMPSHLK